MVRPLGCELEGGTTSVGNLDSGTLSIFPEIKRNINLRNGVLIVRNTAVWTVCLRPGQRVDGGWRRVYLVFDDCRHLRRMTFAPVSRPGPLAKRSLSGWNEAEAPFGVVEGEDDAERASTRSGG